MKINLLTKDKVILSNLCVAHLLVHRVAVVRVGFSAESNLLQLTGHIGGVLVEGDADRHHHDLAWRQPEGPFAAVGLGKDSDHSFYTAQDSSRDIYNYRYYVLYKDLRAALDKRFTDNQGYKTSV